MSDSGEKKEKYTEEDLGKIISFSTENGTYRDERIVQVFCQVCSAQFIGPIREAGGFLGGHEVFHTWEMTRAVLAAGGLGE